MWPLTGIVNGNVFIVSACCGWLWLAAIASDAVENVTKLASLGQVLPRAAPPPHQPRGRRNDKNSLHNISASESSTELVILTAAVDDTDLTSWRWWHETRRRNIIYNYSHIQWWKCSKGLLTACGPVLACLMSPLSPPLSGGSSAAPSCAMSAREKSSPKPGLVTWLRWIRGYYLHPIHRPTYTMVHWWGLEIGDLRWPYLSSLLQWRAGTCSLGWLK